MTALDKQTRSIILIFTVCLVILLAMSAIRPLLPCSGDKQREISEEEKEREILRHITPIKQNISHQRFNFILNEETLCKERGDTQVVLLVAVFVGVNDTVERNYIRKTWGATATTDNRVRLLFITGKPANDSLDRSKFVEESRQHHDIIQADFTDEYRKLSLKSFALFQWTKQYCSNAHYILKIDCDMQVVDMNRLVTVLQTIEIPSKLLCGETWSRAFVYRQKNNKWYVPYEIYPNHTYPMYCVGAAYIIPKRIAAKYASLPVPDPLFPVDDVYFTGIAREKLNEGIVKAFLLFHHHYGKTNIQLTSGRNIMEVRLRE